MNSWVALSAFACAEKRRAFLAYDPDTALRGQPSLRPPASDLEVAEVLQAVGSVP